MSRSLQATWITREGAFTEIAVREEIQSQADIVVPHMVPCYGSAGGERVEVLRTRQNGTPVGFQPSLRRGAHPCRALGFKHARTKGSHHLLKRPDVAQVINLQPDKRNPGKAKKRQVGQLLVLYDQLGFLEER